nr:polysaccharide biosynthesis protein [Oscillospiraceae bacterium]
MDKVISADKNKNAKGGGIISGAFSLTLSTIIVKLLGLIYKVPLASILGDEGMGYFNSAYTVYAFFYLLCTAGVPKALMILISEAKAKGKAIDEANIYRVAMRLFLALGISVTALFVILANPLSRIIGNSNAAATMLAIAPSIVFISLAGVIRGYLSANMCLADIAISQIIEGVGKLVLGLVLAVSASKLELSLPVCSALTMLGVTFGSLLGFIYLSICSKIKLSREKLRQNKVNQAKGVIKRIFAISVPITLSAAIMSITGIIDLTLIMRSLESIGYTESEAAALYGNYTTLAVPMFNLAISVITPISIVFLPTFTKAKVIGDREMSASAEKSAIELTAFVSAPIVIGMTVFASEILTLLFGNSSINVGAPLLCLLAPAIVFASLLMIVNTVLEASGWVRVPVISMLIGSIAKLFVSYLLITNEDVGISGAPIGTVVSYAVALLVSLIIHGIKCDGRLKLFSSCVLPYVTACISVLVARLCYFRLSLSFGNTAGLFLAIIIAAVIYVVISVILGLFGRKKVIELSKYTNFT